MRSRIRKLIFIAVFPLLFFLITAVGDAKKIKIKVKKSQILEIGIENIKKSVKKAYKEGKINDGDEYDSSLYESIRESTTSYAHIIEEEDEKKPEVKESEVDEIKILKVEIKTKDGKKILFIKFKREL